MMRESIGDTLFGILVWLVFAGCYLLFAGSVDGSELIAGLPIASVATVYAVMLHRARQRVLVLRGTPLRVAGRALAALVPDAIRVGRVLLRAIFRRPAREVGAVGHQPFRAGGANAVDAGRRGVVTLGLSLAPNSFVLEIPGGGGDILMHRLVAARGDTDIEWPA